MKATKVPQKLRSIPPPPADPAKAPFLSYAVLSAVVHGVAVLALLGSVWLWGKPFSFPEPSHTVTLVEAPLTLGLTQAGGDGQAPGKPHKAQDLGEPGEPPPPPPAPVIAESAPPAPQVPPMPKVPPVPKAAPELPKELPKPKEEAPKEPPKAVTELPKKPPEPKVELPKEPPKVVEIPKQPPAPKVEIPKEEQTPPKGAMTLPKPPEPKKPPVPQPVTPPPPQAAANDARQAVERLRERQAHEAQAQAEALRAQQQGVAARQAVEQLRERQGREEQAKIDLQAQQQSAEQRLAALRSRYGSGGTGGGTGSGGPGGSGPGGGVGGQGGGISGVRLQAYQDMVREKVIGAWILPMPREEARKLQATASLRVSRDGQVAGLQIIQTSGNSLFDDSLMRAIKQASPLPPLPVDYQGTFLEIEMRFRPS